MLYGEIIHLLDECNAALMVALTAAEALAARDEQDEELQRVLGLVRAHVATAQRLMQRIDERLKQQKIAIYKP